MIVKCEKEVLLKSIKEVLNVIPNKATVPSLKNILIKADDKGLSLISNNLEMAVKIINIKSQIIKNGSISINGKDFNNIINNMPDDVIEISTCEGDNLVIRNGNIKINMVGNEDEFLLPKDIKKKNKKFSINTNMLKDMIESTISFVSKGEFKSILTGSLFQLKNDNLNIVAIDGYRIALKTAKVNSNYKNMSFVLPSNNLRNLIKIIDKKDGIVDISVLDEDHILVKFNNYQIILKTLNGEYLDYEKFFSNEYSLKIKLNRKDLLNSLKRNDALLKNEKEKCVKLNITDDKLIIKSNTDDYDLYEEININILEGKDLKIAFNVKFLIDALKVIEDDEIFMEFRTELNPCTIIGKDYKYLILPLKINE